MVNLQDKEYYCKTCVLNTHIEIFANYEKNNVQTFTPLRLRKTDKIGIIFTEDSILFQYHIGSGQKHEWGKYDEQAQEIARLKNANLL